MRLDGRIYRSPTSISRDDGPARLGMKGGHPVECVRFDRKKSNHTYVFLVRMLRIGSEPAAPIRLGLKGVQENHCRILFSQGKFLIVAPKEDAVTYLGDLEMEPGVIYQYRVEASVSGMAVESQPALIELPRRVDGLLMAPAYPNPFNPRTTLRFYLPKDGERMPDTIENWSLVEAAWGKDAR